VRIVQVLSYVSHDGAYGGPVAVARMQCEYLTKRGHEVHLVAGWDGVAELDIPGVRVHLCRARRLPGLGMAGLISPSVWRTVARLGATADVVHLHVARDLVQMPSASLVRRRGTVVLQAHGMIRPDHRVSARLVDGLATRPLYRAADAHLVLTDDERRDVPVVAGSVQGRIVSIKNAVPVPDVVASWSEEAPRVLFLSRLHERKRPTAFVDMAAEAVRRDSRAVFEMYGPDEGELSAVLARIDKAALQDRVAYRGALSPDQVLPVLASAQVFVLPSINEPFPMALLEAMSVGLPPIITARTGISAELKTRGTAAVTDGTAEDMADALIRLTDSEEAWTAASRSARADIEHSFSCDAVVDTLEEVDQDAVAARESSPVRH
jgi:glycosyltransferase involved in cell wall biosynthesis